MKKRLRTALIIFYIVAGLNHFINPDWYLGLIPDYLPDPVLLNYLSGAAEIILGILVIFPTTRKLACVGIILMLIAFIPAHVHFIEIGSCVDGVLPEVLCLPPWIAWVRLVIIHPILIYWAWHIR